MQHQGLVSSNLSGKEVAIACYSNITQKEGKLKMQEAFPYMFVFPSLLAYGQYGLRMKGVSIHALG
jgi:hypothetical protein